MKDLIINIGSGIGYVTMVWLVFYIAIASFQGLFDYND